MKKSKFHYVGDIISFGIIGPSISIFLFQKALENKMIVLDNTVLSDFIKSISAAQLSSGLILLFLCFIFFGSICYCIQIGVYRALLPEKIARLFIEVLSAVGISTYLVLLATIVLSELQLSLFTAWVAFTALVVSFLKLYVNPDRNKMQDNSNNQQSCDKTPKE